MAEALGGVASVLTIVNSVARVIRTVQSCTNASKEASRLVSELIYIRGLLETLKDTLAEPNSSNGISTPTKSILEGGDGLIHRFQQLLDLLEIAIGNTSTSKGYKRIKHAATWPYKETEALKLIDAVERYKALFSLALQNNHLQLSRGLRASFTTLSFDVSDIKNRVTSNGQQLQILSSTAEDAEYRAVSHWLSNLNYWSKQQDILAQRVGDTDQWFLSTSEFQEWQTSKGASLICLGPPGIGKTVLSSVIIDHLASQFPTDSCVLAFFCNQSDAGQDKHQLLLGSILQQLFRKQDTSWRAIKGLFDRHKHGTSPTSAELLSIIREELGQRDQIYLIIDALDEWSSNLTELKQLIHELRSLAHHLRILVTSRPLTLVEQLFPKSIRVDINLPPDDLRTYIRARVGKSEQSFLKSDFHLQKSVEREVLDKCEGLFLLARLQMDELLRQRHKRAFLKALEKLPRTPDALYDAAIARIELQHDEDVNLAKQALAWVYYAHEPITVNLLQYALAIQPLDFVIDEDGCVETQVLLSLCGGLLVLDQDSQVIRFVHTTTRSYLEEYYRRQTQQHETQLTYPCLTFLLSETFRNFADASFRSLRSNNRLEMSKGSRMMEFIVYASRHVVSHYNSMGKDAICSDLMQQLFKNNDILAIFWRARWRARTKDIVNSLMEFGHSPNTRDSTGQTPLYAAASRGEEKVVNVLLANGADPRQRSFDGPSWLEIDSNAQRFCQTPMHCALRSGNVSLAQTLITHGVELQPSFCDSQPPISPLRIAIQSNSRPMVEFVLKLRHEDLHETGGLGAQPALHDAIENGAVDVVAALLEAGASATSVSRRGQSPIETVLLAPVWRVSDDECQQICKLIVDYSPPLCIVLSDFRFPHYQHKIFRPRTQQYLKLIGAWGSSRKFYSQRRKSV